ESRPGHSKSSAESGAYFEHLPHVALAALGSRRPSRRSRRSVLERLRVCASDEALVRGASILDRYQALRHRNPETSTIIPAPINDSAQTRSRLIQARRNDLRVRAQKRRPRLSKITRETAAFNQSGRQDLNLRPLGPERLKEYSHRFRWALRI